MKFRITSKKTGRKIDINLDFKTKQDTARDELDKDALGCPPAPPQPQAQPPDDRRDEAGDFLVGDAEVVGDDIQVGIGVDPSGEIACADHEDCPQGTVCIDGVCRTLT